MNRSRSGFWCGLRQAVAALLVAVAAVGCGGGGDDAGAAPPAASPYTGSWQLVATVDGQAGQPVAVPAETVPTAEMVSALTTANLAQQVGAGTFQGYAVTVSGGTITVTGPGTSYALTITAFVASGYQGCGACGVGSTVSYNVAVNYTQGGTIDGQVVPAGAGTINLSFRYTRTA